MIVWIACSCVALFSLPAHARPPDRHPTLQMAELTGVTQAPTIEAITSGSLNGAFRPLRTRTIPTSGSSDRWFRLNLDSDWAAAERPVISFKGGYNTRIWVYAPPSYRAHLLWMLQPELKSRFSRHALVEVLPHELRAAQPLYIRIQKNSYGQQITPALTDLSSYQEADLRYVRLITLLMSVQATMTLIGLCLWFTLRDRMFAYFIGYASMQLVYLLMLSGEVYLLPGGWLFTSLGDLGIWPFALLASALSISFIIEFCKFRRSTPRIAAALGWIRWPLIAASPLFLIPLGGFEPVTRGVLNVLILTSSLMAIGALALAVSKGNRHARFLLIAWMPQVALTTFRVVQLMVGWRESPWIEYGFPFTLAFASVVVILGLTDLTVAARRERDIADHLAHHDALTGTLNRRAVLIRLTAAIAEAIRHGRPLAVLFIDIDHFKSINDNYGHQAGDRCLQAIVEVIGQELRSDDWTGRYGGEEFVIALPGANRENAVAIGERVRARAEALCVPSREQLIRMTISVGIASLLDSHDTVDALIGRADAALYRAKSDGRNRLAIHPSLETARA
jgi:diguanylate cyclase (GGDEF)-like protein